METTHTQGEAATAAVIRDFVRTTVTWAVAAAGLATLHRIWTNVTGATGGGWDGVAAALRDAPHFLAAFLPLTVFAGGLAMARPGRTSMRVRLALALVSATLALVLTGYVAPLIETGLVHAGLTGAEPWSGTEVARTLGFWKREYDALLAQQTAGEPVLTWMVAAAGVQYYMPLTAAALAAIVTGLGLAVGMRTATLRSFRRAVLHDLLTGTVLVGLVVVAYRVALGLAWSGAVSPGVALSLIPVPPALLLLALAWNALITQPASVTPHDGR